MSSPDPNYKFREVANYADNLLVAMAEIAAYYHEATKDGINAYRAERIRLCCNRLETGIRYMREELEPQTRGN